MAKKKLKENTAKTGAGDGKVGQVVVGAAGAAAAHHHSSGQDANLQQQHQPAMERGKRPRDGDTERVGANTNRSSADSSAPLSDADDDAMPPTQPVAGPAATSSTRVLEKQQDAVAVAVEDPLAQLGLIHEVHYEEEEDDDEEDIHILTNAEVAAEVDKAPLWQTKHSLDQQRVHMEAAVGKVWMTLMHHWHNHLDMKIAVALLTGESSFGRKLAFLTNESTDAPLHDEEDSWMFCTASGFAPLRTDSFTNLFNVSVATCTMQSRAFWGHANTVIEELKKHVATQPPGTFEVQDGRLVVQGEWVLSLDEAFIHFLHFLYHSALLDQIDVVKALLQHVKLTDDQARECFSWALCWKKTELGERRPVSSLVNMLAEMRIIEPEAQLRRAVIANHVEFVRKFGTPSSLNCHDNLHSCTPSSLLQNDTRYGPYLHEAVSIGAALMVKVLLEKGADLHATDFKDRTALQLAQECDPQNQEIINILVA